MLTVLFLANRSPWIGIVPASMMFRSGAPLLLALAAGSSDGRRLPAPASDFFFPGGADTNFSYHNVATLGPSPRVVVENATREWELLESNPAQQYFGGGPVKVDSCSQMDLVRGQAASFLGASGGAAEIALMPSTTVSFNELAQGLVVSGFLGKGDRVLTSDQEHQGAIGCWQFYGDGYKPALNVTGMGIISLDRAEVPVPPPSSAEIVEIFRKAMTPRTKVISVSHVLTTNGLQMPIKELADLAHAHGAILVVDGAQAPGGLNVNLSALGVDAYATSCHKWMLAPKGNGLLYIKKSVQPWVKSMMLAGGFTACESSSNDLAPR